MDGHYVPNITFGPNIVKSLRPVTNKILDVHLMISPVEKYINNFEVIFDSEDSNMISWVEGDNKESLIFIFLSGVFIFKTLLEIDENISRKSM